MADVIVSADIDTLMLAANFPAAKTAQGLGTGDSPQFAGVNIGAATDTTVTRASAGVIAVEGKNVYVAGGAKVATADGGTAIDSSALTGFGYVTAGTWAAKTAIQADILLDVAAAAIASTAIDWATAKVFSKTLGANTTFTFSNAVDGETRVVALTNTASNYTVTWPTVLWTGGASPVQTIGAKTDVYTFIKIGSSIYGSVVQNFS